MYLHTPHTHREGVTMRTANPMYICMYVYTHAHTRTHTHTPHTHTHTGRDHANGESRGTHLLTQGVKVFLMCF